MTKAEVLLVSKGSKVCTPSVWTQVKPGEQAEYCGGLGVTTASAGLAYYNPGGGCSVRSAEDPIRV